MKAAKYTFIIMFFLIGWSNASAQFVTDVKKATPTVKNERAKIFYQILSRTKDPQIIDIRTPREYAAGHLKGAIMVNYYDRNFADNLEKAGLDKFRPVFIYCRSGHRSSNAIAIFQKLGFRHIVNMVYGINEWQHLQLPIEK